MSLLSVLALLLAICLLLPSLAAAAQVLTPYLGAACVLALIWRMAFPPKARRR